MTTNVFNSHLDINQTHILREMNERAKQYRGFAFLTTERRQAQTEQDFQRYIKPGEFVRLTDEQVKENNYTEHFARAS